MPHILSNSQLPVQSSSSMHHYEWVALCQLPENWNKCVIFSRHLEEMMMTTFVVGGIRYILVSQFCSVVD